MKGRTAALLTLAAMVAGTFLGMFLDRALFVSPPEPGEEKADTVWITKPSPVMTPTAKPISIFLSSIPIPIPVFDTLHERETVHDTLWLPMEQKYYREEEYEAWISGYRPKLDSIRLFPKVPVVTIQQSPPPKRWGIGIQVGAGAGKEGLTPYVGIGISYNVLTF